MPGPIEHVVIIVKENHGFDTYFGRFPGADGDATLAQASNPPATDPPHSHEAWTKRSTDAVRQQYAEADIPVYWRWAREYTLCDRYFTDVAGPSTPNHVMLIAADSPWIDNPHGGYRAGAQNQADLPSLPAQLQAAGHDWANYGGYAFDFLAGLAAGKRPSDRFAQDAAAGRLPAVSWVYADHVHSEHAPDGSADRTAGVGNVTAGMEWTAAQVDAVVAGGLWDSTAIFVTWDDWGGWADHVDPPEVETWSDGSQFRYGGRVPCLVLGAYAKAGYVSHAQHSHVSLVRFCETTFGLPSLNARTAAADDMADCFDFSRRLPAPGRFATPVATRESATLRAVLDAAARANERITAALAATTDGTVRRQLHWAAQDVERIRQLSGDEPPSRPGD